ncbi:MAG: hypothetical protein KatS3mg131_3621 [Candidatus Tectimicrobiota bacterium]|nr:MAG: hypothetical protein KatS3mg131_3621 [Candidatus Tectomicrobia bacterium]
MNWAHAHLVLVHVPVVGLAFGLLLLGLAWVRHRPEVLRAGCLLLVLSALLAFFAFLTGEPAEETVEHLPGVAEGLIERHAAAALPATLATGLAGAAALAVLLRRRSAGMARSWLAVLLALTLLASGAMAWTASLGGQIRHPEIRSAWTGQGKDDEGFWQRLPGTARRGDRHEKENGDD